MFIIVEFYNLWKHSDSNRPYLQIYLCIWNESLTINKQEKRHNDSFGQ